MTAARSPLAGKRLVVTRPRPQAPALAERLRALGAVPVLCPTIEIAPLADPAPLDRALAALPGYQWLIFTSVNGVAAVWDRLAALGLAFPHAGPQVAAIGPATARALAERGVAVRHVPDEYVAEAIAGGLGDVAGQWVLLPRAELAREALADELGRRGAVVHEVAAYHTLPAVPDAAGLAAWQAGVDAVTFTSASTVRSAVALLERAGLPRRLLTEPALACIGPITAQAARALGLRVAVQAAEYTIDGLVAALVAYYQQKETA